MKPLCFISYSREDVEPEHISHIKERLVATSGGNLNILHDGDLPPGKNFDIFMNRIDEVDGVLILLSPSYGTKIRDRKITSGVYKEFKRIMQRFDEVELAVRENADTRSEFSIIPILYSGKANVSVPHEIANLNWLDFRSFRLVTDKESKRPILPRGLQSNFKRKFEAINRELMAVRNLRSEDYWSLHADLFERMFINLKEEFQTREKGHFEGLDKKLFVKTNPYRRVESQAVHIVVGRKGSGKTTAVKHLTNSQENKYKGAFQIVANEIDLESLYSLFQSPKFKSDATYYFSRELVFRLFWELFLFVSIVDTLAVKADHTGFRQRQLDELPHLTDFIDQIVQNAELAARNKPTKLYVAFCQSALEQFMDDCIDRARTDPKYFRTDIVASFSSMGLIEFAAGKSAVKATKNILNLCRKRILLSLDGFDSLFEEFRVHTIRQTAEQTLAVYERTYFEIDWLKALLHLILDIKVKREWVLDAEHLLDVCLALPQDRFDEILANERDAVNFSGRFAELNWSGIDLTILLRKRLEILTEGQRFVDDSPERNLRAALKEVSGLIPQMVTTEVGGKTYRLPLFLYVLRHTFWRPREILIYCGGLLALAKSCESKKMKVTNAAVKRVIRRSTYKVIRLEFFNEFRNSLVNLEDIVDTFFAKKQILEFSEISDLLGEIDFEFAGRTHPTKSFEDKFDYLYGIGFLGIQGERKQMSRLGTDFAEAFVFSEGRHFLANVRADPTCFRYVIHPIFCERLQLDTSMGLTLAFTWKYLFELESHFGP